MIHLFDCFISRVPTKRKHMIPVALEALQIVAKLEESETKVITYKKLNKHIFLIGLSTYIKLEKVMLMNSRFQLNVVSPFKILWFLLHEFKKEKYSFYSSKQQDKEFRKEFQRKMLEFHFISLIEYDFYRFNSISVAIGIIVTARRCMGLEPWTEEMKSFTGKSIGELETIVSFFFSFERLSLINHLFDEHYSLQILKKNLLSVSFSEEEW